MGNVWWSVEMSWAMYGGVWRCHGIEQFIRECETASWLWAMCGSGLSDVSSSWTIHLRKLMPGGTNFNPLPAVPDVKEAFSPMWRRCLKNLISLAYLAMS
ncbi:hypothetical protein AVEN_127847-1 [Araneus ventricosus]|uniref:Uncharacterized protein n=1 Tax=Araneus ventricosus TaxID=182803 RepID=A0A4Y1ZZP3_ARAVE|nr:hypothetical protein AVEN_127847-1 [Araneus ventricosus]